MRSLTILLCTLLFLSCKDNDKTLSGTWVNVNFEDQDDFVLYDFREGYVYCSNSKGIKKRKWEIDGKNLILEDDKLSIKYEIKFLDNEELQLFQSNGLKTVFLLPKHNFASNSDITTFLKGKTWNYEVHGNDDYNDDFLVNEFHFIDKGKVVNHFVLQDSTRHINVLGYELFNYEKVNVLKVYEGFNLYFFILDFQGGNLNAIKSTQKSYDLIELRANIENPLVTQKVRNSINGDWISTNSNSFIESISFNSEIRNYIVEDNGSSFLKDGSFVISSNNKLLIMYGSNNTIVSIYSIDMLTEDSLTLSSLSKDQFKIEFKRITAGASRVKIK